MYTAFILSSVHGHLFSHCAILAQMSVARKHESLRNETIFLHFFLDFLCDLTKPPVCPRMDGYFIRAKKPVE